MYYGDAKIVKCTLGLTGFDKLFPNTCQTNKFIDSLNDEYNSVL